MSGEGKCYMGKLFVCYCPIHCELPSDEWRGESAIWENFLCVSVPYTVNCPPMSGEGERKSAIWENFLCVTVPYTVNCPPMSGEGSYMGKSAIIYTVNCPPMSGRGKRFVCFCPIHCELPSDEWREESAIWENFCVLLSHTL
ncbi:hypothetical protein CEXT_234291 [Caerostris extrusa]|uniref:Uncharacterized protein n=1 Tax=Caerostris extrusa TaxID=172846 RepID=A0AAV4QU98_CAEEX|nr:hypothetical protein CEXT_234291 [Caerostris extrusa]